MRKYMHYVKLLEMLYMSSTNVIAYMCALFPVNTFCLGANKSVNGDRLKVAGTLFVVVNPEVKLR